MGTHSDPPVPSGGQLSIMEMEQHRPYAETIPKKEYQRALHDLQVELVKLQKWVVEHGERIVIVFEGRDAAGKGGAIRRFSEYLNPHQARIASLPNRTTPSARSGTSSATSPTSPRPARSSCSTGPGTTAPAWST